MTALAWEWKAFAELSLQELYAILKLRQDVFVVEQACCYQDLDCADQDALHLLGRDGEQLLAYQRAFAPGVQCEESLIGRIIVAESARGSGLGSELVGRGIEFCQSRYPGAGIRIAAQAHLEDFYGRSGFICVSDSPYDVDGIPHIDMLHRLQ